MGEDLVNAQGDLATRFHVPVDQVIGDQLPRQVLTHCRTSIQIDPTRSSHCQGPGLLSVP
jgi:hypothetical protein